MRVMPQFSISRFADDILRISTLLGGIGKILGRVMSQLSDSVPNLVVAKWHTFTGRLTKMVRAIREAQVGQGKDKQFPQGRVRDLSS